MPRPVGQIQDILTDKSIDSIYVEGANDFEEWTVLVDNEFEETNFTMLENDIVILEDVEALW